MRQRSEAEFAVGKALKLDIRGMLVDLIGIDACTRAHGERGGVFICDAGQIVEQAACKASEPL